VDLALRLGTGAGVVGIGTFALISTAMQVDHPMSDPLTAIAIYAALWWFGMGRPAVWLFPDKMVVRNPLWTHRIARDNVVSAEFRPFGGGVIIRRDGRPCATWALYRPKIAEDRADSLITYWAQTSRSSNHGEASGSSYAETQESPTRRVIEIVAAAGLAIALTIPALLVAWPHNPQWLWPVSGVIMVIAFVPFIFTRQIRNAFRRDLRGPNA
jgi:hypothetical protein